MLSPAPALNGVSARQSGFLWPLTRFEWCDIRTLDFPDNSCRKEITADPESVSDPAQKQILQDG